MAAVGGVARWKRVSPSISGPVRKVLQGVWELQPVQGSHRTTHFRRSPPAANEGMTKPRLVISDDRTAASDQS